MKKFILLAASLLTISACSPSGGSSDTSKSSSGDEPISISVPESVSIPEQPDGYKDVLPDDTKDGNILHAFCWSYKQIKENLPSIALAGFKSVETMPVQQPKGGGSSWWSYYQPLSFSIADNASVGTKQDLKDLCEEADKYGISIIADIVFNHMANIQDKEYESDGTPKVNPDVAKYESYIYEHRNDSGSSATFHHNKNAMGSGAITQFYQYGDLPDLNTANPYVQERCLSLLKECIDVGIDGFRIDTAKHVETPEDPEYASDFWPNVVEPAKEYYESKTNKDLFIWGEILGEPGGGRTVGMYAKYMAMTDDGYISDINAGTGNPNAAKLANAKYTKNTDPSNLVTWVESHDTFTSGSTHASAARVARMWAVIGSRKSSRGLYLARPDDALTVGKVADYEFENENIAVINRFHNRFKDSEEYQGYLGKIYFNERVSENGNGAVIVDTEHTGHVTLNLPHLGTGIYYDQLTGVAVNVNQGYADFDTDANGVAVLTKSKNAPKPRITISSRGGSFVGSMNLDIKVENVPSFKYQINSKSEVEVTTGSVKLTLGSDVKTDNSITVKLIAGDVTKEFNFKKIDLIPGKFNVVNLKPEYFTDYELYIWSWVNAGSWNKNYTVQNGVFYMIQLD